MMFNSLPKASIQSSSINSSNPPRPISPQMKFTEKIDDNEIISNNSISQEAVFEQSNNDHPKHTIPLERPPKPSRSKNNNRIVDKKLLPHYCTVPCRTNDPMYYAVKMLTNP